MIGLIGKKVGMTQIFGDKGQVLPVTVIEAGPCTVTSVRKPEKEGYTALQLGFGTNKETRFTKPVLGQFTKHNLTPARHVREFRVDEGHGYEVGKSLTVELFAKGEYVDVEGVTKGRGFTGVGRRAKSTPKAALTRLGWVIMRISSVVRSPSVVMRMASADFMGDHPVLLSHDHSMPAV